MRSFVAEGQLNTDAAAGATQLSGGGIAAQDAAVEDGLSGKDAHPRWRIGTKPEDQFMCAHSWDNCAAAGG